jgi:hypothetical protein
LGCEEVQSDLDSDHFELSYDDLYRFVDLNALNYEPIPLDYDPLEGLNELLAEEETDDMICNEDLVKINLLDAKPTFIQVDRDDEIDESRRELPVYMHEHEVCPPIY